MFDLYRAEDLINQQEILITLIQNKMKDEYIIINKTAIEKRIEELIKEANSGKTIPSVNSQMAESLIKFKEYLLSQSTPLIPEIKKAIEFGKDIRGEKSFINDNYGSPFIDYEDSTEETNNYITNLKLDI